jgi:hypothetical protein
MSLIHKKRLYFLGVMAITMTNCTSTNSKTSLPPPTDPPTASTCFQASNLPRIPKQACAVSIPLQSAHYSGGCQNGKAHGHGLAIGKDIYEGEFANGLPHGQGTYTWLDKNCFTGQFINGVPQVPHVGCYVADPRLRGRYDGECLSGKAHGRGKAKGIDLYQGEFIGGVLNGKGTYVQPNGDRYVGQFKEGEISGRGMMIYADGTRKELRN